MIIHLLGAPRAGKDTAAAIMRFAGFEPLSVSKLIRQEIELEMTGATNYLAECTDSLARGLLEYRLRTLKEGGISPLDEFPPPLLRETLQLWGTEFRRNQCGTDYWVDLLHERVERTKDAAIVGTRFINEWDAFPGAGIFITGREYVPDTPSHESERLTRNLLDIYGSPVFCGHPVKYVTNNNPKFFAENLRNALRNLSALEGYEALRDRIA